MPARDTSKHENKPLPKWSYLDTLTHTLPTAGRDISEFRKALTEGGAQLERRFRDDEPVEHLVRDRAHLVDALLLEAWRQHEVDSNDQLALLAVGGYGRGELHPCSDIDITVLLPEADSDDWAPKLEGFLTFLWDIGLQVGHSVRTIADCAREAADITVATTLMEARLLCGSAELFAAMRQTLEPDKIWPSRDFFEAKRREQIARHHRYHDTAYNLEPNVKGSPGGLRDIQVIGWVAKRHFEADTLDELVDHGFLTANELRKLLAGQAFLWKVRFALHVLTGRREDRLLFDHQVRIAGFFGYKDASHSLAVEQFMQNYYRTVMELSRLNEMLLQLFQEAMLFSPDAPPRSISSRFQIRNGYLEVTDDDVFTRQPSALLEIFLVLQQHPELRGVSASTIRLIRKHLLLIDERFRNDARHHRLFLEILRAPAGVTHELRRMNLYGVLGRYVLAFGRIVGRMQYDLFHAYTVDEHTLFVISNLRRFALTRYNHEFPYCSEIMQALPRPELAYLAAMFHDIAKGRGGDHSELGAVDAEAFCTEHGLSRYDARLVAWLVRHHLALSLTAQKKDISDPQVIHDFAAHVGDQVHLDYLYILTVADVRGTNPKLWNSWKAALFEELYERTKRALRRGLENPIDKDELIAETQAAAGERLETAGITATAARKIWKTLPDEYFLRHTPQEIAWHTELLAHDGAEVDEVRIAVQDMTERGGTAIFVYAPIGRQSFARVTAVLDELGLTIHDARIIPTDQEYSLDTYVVLEDDGGAIHDPGRIAEIERAIRRSLEEAGRAPRTVRRRAPRQVRMFSTSTTITFVDDTENTRTIMELVAGDRPGLLSEVGKIFLAAGVDIRAAKIATIGERAEDVFYIRDRHGRPLGEDLRKVVEEQLREVLDRRTNARGQK